MRLIIEARRQANSPFSAGARLALLGRNARDGFTLSRQGKWNINPRRTTDEETRIWHGM